LATKAGQQLVAYEKGAAMNLLTEVVESDA
jgi:hypothetical protein